MDKNDLIMGVDKDFLKMNPGEYSAIATKEKRKNKRIEGGFICGPLPLIWIQKACSLGKNTAKLSLLLWYKHGLTKGQPFYISNLAAEKFGLERRQKYRALSLLEEAGLITIEQDPGNSPTIQVIEEIS